jgi:putative phosphoesterase
MRLGILSDTHNQVDRARRAAELLESLGAEALVHCGDLAIVEVVAACADLPLYFAIGNHDADNVPALRAAAEAHGAVCLGYGGELTLAGKRVAVTHGHLTMDLRPLLAAGPDYLLTGHSHAPMDRRDGPTRRINPGALFRAAEFTVALLDLESDELQFLTVPR